MYSESYRPDGKKKNSRKISEPTHRILDTEEECQVFVPNGVSLNGLQRQWLHIRATEENELRSEWTNIPIRKKSIHHIESLLWSIVHGRTPNQYNRPDNLIVLYSHEHFERIHPEQKALLLLKENDPETFERELAKINTQVLNGIPNWVTTWDEELEEIAYNRTIRMLEKGKLWPQSDGTQLTLREFRRLTR